MNFLWFFGLVCLCVSAVESQLNSDSVTMHYCGSELNDALSLVCKGKYNELKIQSKRNLDDNMMEEKSADDQQDKSGETWPYLTKRSASSMLASHSHHQRHKRGIVEECCKKACSKSEMLSYCAPP